jgi:hypothetical protein
MQTQMNIILTVIAQVGKENGNMATEKQFVDGLIIKFLGPHGDRGSAPDFIKGKLSIKCVDLVAFMRQHQSDGWVNVDLKMSKNGKLYAELNSWKKEAAPAKDNWSMDSDQKQAYDEAAQGHDSPNPPTGEDIPF